MNEEKVLKIVLVGDGAVGKTCILIAYTTNTFPGEYIPTIFDNFQQATMVDGISLTLSLYDTAGQEEYDRLRVMAYPGADVFLLCFAVTVHPSFENVAQKWAPEIRHFCPEASIVLVGTKIDLRNDKELPQNIAPEKTLPISKDQGIEKCAEIGAEAYCECSSLYRQGIPEVMNVAARIGMACKYKHKQRRRARCNII